MTPDYSKMADDYVRRSAGVYGYFSTQVIQVMEHEIRTAYCRGAADAMREIHSSIQKIPPGEAQPSTASERGQ